MKKLFALFLVILLSGCSSTLFMKGDVIDLKGEYSPTKEEEIKIYTDEQNRKKSRKMFEIGIVTVRGGQPVVDGIYKKMRSKGADVGAHEIHDVKIDSETKQKWVTVQDCSRMNAPCQSRQELRMETTFTATGTLMRFKK